MRVILSSVCALAACFNPHAAEEVACADNGACPGAMVCDPVDQRCRLEPLPDAGAVYDASIQPPPPEDGPAPDVPGCGGLVWEADFGADPLGRDANHDGVADWVLRGGPATFPDELVGGVWRSSQTRELDTRPLHAFRTRTRASVRMRSTSPPGQGGLAGAVLWLNVDDTGSAYASISVQLRLTDTGDAQRLVLQAKTGPTSHEVLATFLVETTGFVDVDLDIDPSTSKAGLVVDGVDFGRYRYTRWSYGNADRWATLATFRGGAEFDHVRIESCAP
jgi:hypothetical protein